MRAFEFLSENKGINEGLIKLPQSNVDEASAWIKQKVHLEILLQIHKKSNKSYADQFAQIVGYDKSVPKPTLTLVIDTELYKKYIKEVPADIPVMFVDDLTSDGEEVAGYYHDDDKTIRITTAFMVWAGNNIVKMFKKYEAGSDWYDNIEEFNDHIIEITNDAISEVMGAFKHEFTHAIQYNIHGLLHSKQMDLKPGYDNYDDAEKQTVDYFTSQMEFDPYIKQSIDEFNQHMKNVEKDLPGEGTKGSYHYDNALLQYLSLENKSSALLIDPSPFFETMKKNAPVRYKKAVKYFMSNLGS